MNHEQRAIFEEFLRDHGKHLVEEVPVSLERLVEKMLIVGWNDAAESTCGCLWRKEYDETPT